MSDAPFALLRDYLKQVETYFKAGIATEHTYRPALQHLLQACVGGITVTNEPKRVACGAPDYVISRLIGSNALTIGYVEAKDIGVSLDKVEHGEQMGRYLRALDNLVLTDYLEFRSYVKGEKQMTARLATSHSGKSLALDNTGTQQVADLLDSFLNHSPEPIRKPADLARRMARLAHMIRDITVTAFEQHEASDTLAGLYEAFKAVLLPDLPPAQFADMFAQTLAYGLFAARYNHKGNTLFNRRDAAQEIPRTNPFLRKLFNTIAGADFDDEPFIGFVNELTQVLGVTDMEAVLADFGKRTRQEDPIVHFYETFLAQYDPKLRELRGVYYTPEPVVSYIVRSVDYLLREQFDLPDGLADTATITRTTTDENGEIQSERSPRVLILDPACGTGTFSYAIVDLIRETYRQTGNAGMWSSYVRKHLLPRLFGFELLMAPYAVAHLKLGMQLAALDLPKEERAAWAYDFASDERLGIFLTNTLEQALVRSRLLLGSFISEEANEAAKIKQDSPVMVVIGNPPYSGHSANKGEWITDLLHGDDGRAGKKVGNYFEVDGKPLGERNPKWLNDDYVKFLRFAQWRIEQTGYGILAFITNHGYLDNPTFRGMRQSLMQTFDDIYVLDLHGNSKKKERSPDGSKDENVFDIQQGVAIGIFVKRQRKPDTADAAIVHHAHLWGPREIYEKVESEQRLVGGKYYWLAENDMTTTPWIAFTPDKDFYRFMPQSKDIYLEYAHFQKITEIFLINSVGLTTGQDAKTISPTRLEATDQAKSFSLPSNVIKPILYRPFDKQFVVYDNEVITRPRIEVMSHMLAEKNIAIATTRSIEIGRGWEHIFCSNELIQLHSVSIKEINYLFPLYLYPNPKKGTLFDVNEPSTAPGGRRPNLSPAFIADISSKLTMQFAADGKGDLQQTFGPEDVFHYMYAVFHSPTYRMRYAEFLKIDFPRLSLTTHVDLFRALCKLGERLVGLHLMEKFGTTIIKYPVNGNNVVEKIEYLEPGDQPEQGRVYINKTQYFEGVQPDVWNFHVGGYQVCHKWLKDRKGRTLTFDDLKHYQRFVAALAETITLMEQIDEAIEEHGGWPLA
jgi:predicted helicase